MIDYGDGNTVTWKCQVCGNPDCKNPYDCSHRREVEKYAEWQAAKKAEMLRMMEETVESVLRKHGLIP